MLALLLPIRPAIAQTVAWSGVDAISQVNSNWSDANNWSGGTPRSNALIYFFDAGTNGARGVANNIVSSNTTIFSLEYGNTNGFHTTQISAGARLTISNNGVDNFVYVGTLLSGY